jgi:hypothetical protein
MGITEVWKHFVLFIEGHLANGSKKGMLLPGVVNPVIVSGYFESPKPPTMA